jgi:glycosyltransferase involved in cell wall biosynthesis
MMQESNNLQLDGSRVLFIDLSNNFGGASVRALSLLSQLPKDNAALVALNSSPVALDAAKMGIKVYSVAHSKFDPRLFIQLVRIIRSGHYNVVDSANIQSKLWAVLATRYTKTALVSTLNSYYKIEHQHSLKGRLYQKLDAITQALTEHNIVVSKEILDNLLADGVKRETITLIPNAVDPRLAQISADKQWLRSQWAIPADTIICCSIGRLVDAKDFDLLIRSAAAIKQCQLHYIIIGEGPLRQQLEALIQQLQLQHRVHLIGFCARQETLKILASSDFFVISSRTEGTPLALFEAAALSIPIIATKVGGIPDILTDQQHALLVGAEDVAQLSAAIMTFYTRPAFAKQLAAAAYQQVNEHNDFTRQLSACLDVYKAARQL